MVKEVAGLKVALIPVAQDTSPEVSSTGSLKFLPTVETAWRRPRPRGKGAPIWWWAWCRPTWRTTAR